MRLCLRVLGVSLLLLVLRSEALLPWDVPKSRLGIGLRFRFCRACLRSRLVRLRLRRVLVSSSRVVLLQCSFSWSFLLGRNLSMPCPRVRLLVLGRRIWSLLLFPLFPCRLGPGLSLGRCGFLGGSRIWGFCPRFLLGRCRFRLAQLRDERFRV